MTIGPVDPWTNVLANRGGATATGGREAARTPEALVVGQVLEVQVVERLGANRYAVTLQGERLVAESTLQLDVGGLVRVLVQHAGEQAELRVLPDEADVAIAQSLAALAARHRVSLETTEHDSLATRAAASVDPPATLRAGLYLRKLGLEAEPAALEALTTAQMSTAAPQATERARGSASDAGSELAASLLRHLQAALPPADADGASAAPQPSEAGAGAFDGHSGSDARGDGQSQRRLAEWLLGQSDGGTVQYHYASLPLLVNGALLELDMALFQQRGSASPVEAPRRLVVSLTTETLGAIRIVTQSLADRLTISLSSTRPEAVAQLSTAIDSMREDVRALGWQVDALRVDLATESPRAARDVIDHVLAAGALDRAV